jgi:hypothetical protein
VLLPPAQYSSTLPNTGKDHKFGWYPANNMTEVSYSQFFSVVNLANDELLIADNNLDNYLY